MPLSSIKNLGFLSVICLILKNTHSFDVSKKRNYDEFCGPKSTDGRKCAYCDAEARHGTYGFEFYGTENDARTIDFFRRGTYKTPTNINTKEPLAIKFFGGFNCTAMACYWGDILDAPSYTDRFYGNKYWESVPRSYAGICDLDLRSYFMSESNSLRCYNQSTGDEFVVRVILGRPGYGNPWMSHSQWANRNQSYPNTAMLMNGIQKLPLDEMNHYLPYASHWVVSEKAPMLLMTILGVIMGVIIGVVLFILPENFGDCLIEAQLLALAKEDEDAANIR